MTEAEGAHRSNLSARQAFLLLALLAGALVLRLWGNAWGLPFTYHPDEHQYVDSAVAMLSGDLNPGRFNNPALLKYLNLAWMTALYAIGRLAGWWGSVPELQAAFAADPTLMYRLARTFVALLGVATVAVVGHLGRLVFDGRTGLVAAAYLGGAFLHVRNSHYATSDVPATLWMAVGLWLSVRLLHHGQRRDLWLGALVVGLASATKYSALLVALPIGAAWALYGWPREARSWRRRLESPLRRLLSPAVLLAVAIAVVAFLVAAPYSVLDHPAFLEDLRTLARRGREGFKGLAIDDDPGWIFYLESLRWGLGWPLLAASLGGMLLAFRSRRPAPWLLALVPLLLWAYLGSQLLMFARFMMPALPPLMVLAAHLTVRGADALSQRLGGRREALLAALAFVVLAPSLASAVRHDQLLGRSDTRTLARRWLEAHVADGTRVLLQSSGPELGPPGTPPGAPELEVEKVGTLDLPEQSVAAWRAEGWQLLVTSSFASDRRLLDDVEDARYRAYYAELDAELPTVARFAPSPSGDRPPFVFAQLYGPATALWSIERPGPLVQIHALAPEADWGR